MVAPLHVLLVFTGPFGGVALPPAQFYSPFIIEGSIDDEVWLHSFTHSHISTWMCLGEDMEEHWYDFGGSCTSSSEGGTHCAIDLDDVKYKSSFWAPKLCRTYSDYQDHIRRMIAHSQDPFENWMVRSHDGCEAILREREADCEEYDYSVGFCWRGIHYESCKHCTPSASTLTLDIEGKTLVVPAGGAASCLRIFKYPHGILKLLSGDFNLVVVALLACLQLFGTVQTVVGRCYYERRRGKTRSAMSVNVQVTLGIFKLVWFGACFHWLFLTYVANKNSYDTELELYFHFVSMPAARPALLGINSALGLVAVPPGSPQPSRPVRRFLRVAKIVLLAPSVMVAGQVFVTLINPYGYPNVLVHGGIGLIVAVFAQALGTIVGGSVDFLVGKFVPPREDLGRTATWFLSRSNWWLFGGRKFKGTAAIILLSASFTGNFLVWGFGQAGGSNSASFKATFMSFFRTELSFRLDFLLGVVIPGIPPLFFQAVLFDLHVADIQNLHDFSWASLLFWRLVDVVFFVAARLLEKPLLLAEPDLRRVSPDGPQVTTLGASEQPA